MAKQYGPAVPAGLSWGKRTANRCQKECGGKGHSKSKHTACVRKCIAKASAPAKRRSKKGKRGLPKAFEGIKCMTTGSAPARLCRRNRKSKRRSLYVRVRPPVQRSK